MRHGLLAAAVLLAPAAAPAADPPVVFQTQPLGRVLDDARRTARTLGGEKAVKGVTAELRRAFGEKGLLGLDLERPIVGYVLVPADPIDTVAVVAVPITGEKDYLDLVERANRQKPPRTRDGLHELPPVTPELSALMRVADGYAYIATGRKAPTDALDPKNLVAPEKLFDAGERALVSARIHFDRFPAGSRETLAAYLGLLKLVKPEGGPPFFFGRTERAIFGPLLPRLAEMGRKYIDLTKGAKDLVARLDLDPATADLKVELVLTPLAGSEVAKQIAARAPTTNRFGALLTPDTAMGFRTRLPLFDPELRAGVAEAIGGAEKELGMGAPPDIKPLLDELFPALVRTVKTGEVDIAGAVRGPDKDGFFTAVGAARFEEPAAFEKALRTYAEGTPWAKNFAWGTHKVGDVAVHTYTYPPAALPRDLRAVFGEKVSMAFAFAPHGAFAAMGPDPLPVLKEALAAKPVASPIIGTVVNPARFVKLIGAMDGEFAERRFVEAFGKADKPVSVVNLTIDGGADLRVGFTLSLRPIGAPAEPEPSPPPPPPPPFKN